MFVHQVGVLLLDDLVHVLKRKTWVDRLLGQIVPTFLLVMIKGRVRSSREGSGGRISHEGVRDASFNQFVLVVDRPLLTSLLLLLEVLQDFDHVVVIDLILLFALQK